MSATTTATTITDVSLAELLASRSSCRAFLDEELPSELVNDLFALAQRTPSWCNTQPWQVHLLSGTATQALADALTAHVLDSAESPDLPPPARYDGVYADRRRASGYALYASLGIERDDAAGRQAQLLENFRFFGAPHVAIITTEQDHGVYGAVDCGAYVSTLLLAAESLGVGAIAQAAIAMYSAKVREHLGLPESRRIVCAVAFGRADREHPANTCRTERAPLDEVVIQVPSPALSEGKSR